MVPPHALQGTAMSNRTPGDSSKDAVSSPLADALGKSKEATEDVKKAADDLAVVHAVLETKLAKGVADEDAARAIAETDRLEKRLTQSAEKLDQVNETLEQEVKRAS